MPHRSRPRVDPTDDWEQLQLLTAWSEQRVYELIRPVVLFGFTPAERALQTKAPERTLRRKAHAFETYGMVSLFADFRAPSQEDKRSLPPYLRQIIVDLKHQHPAFRPGEIAQICYVASGRRLSPHTVRKILATGPKPSRLDRRYPVYAEFDDAAEGRLAIIRLHAEGWRISTIATYLETTRRRVYETLHRWIVEGVRGLDDKPSVPKRPARRVDLHAMNEVRKLQQNPLLGEYRIYAALKQLDIRLSPRTCGRILALNRSMYHLEAPISKESHEPKPMPFQASRRHQYWTVDVRYLDMHQLGGGMIYVITILENFSRAILASAVSRAQDLTAYLMVLYAAIRQHGCPEALVSDSGSIFKAKEAMRIYAALGIQKEQIDRKQPWQSYIETNFNVQRRMADWHFAHAESWSELVTSHDRWVAAFNYQEHWAHRSRHDDRHSPVAVLGWVQGVQRSTDELHRIFYAARSLRRVDQLGYVRFRHWRIYGAGGLAKQRAAIWLYSETLTVEFNEEPLAQYTVSYESGRRQLRTVEPRRLFETTYCSPQQALWELGDGEWLKVVRLPAPRRLSPRAHIHLQLTLAL